MSTVVYQVDAFAERAFAGNPAGVVPLERAIDLAWAQAFAAEMNLAETAYFWPEGEAFRLRWWTPETEVRLCGHATLASAHVLWSAGLLDPGAPARFETHSGRLTCRRLADGTIEMDFPARPPAPCETPAGVEEALGARPVEAHQSAEDLLVVLGSEAEVRALTPDFRALGRLPVRGTIVTASADPETGADFVSRFFAPAVGIDEDPVTGSAHCVLTPYWTGRLGRAELIGFQASRRGGFVRVRAAGDRVSLGGRAVTVFRAELATPPRLD